MEPPSLKDELKFVSIIGGALSVMICGLMMMQMWPVDNLDSVALVRFSQLASATYMIVQVLK